MKSIWLGIMCSLYVYTVEGHTILATPIPRENSVHTDTSNFQCGASTEIKATYQRGQAVPVKWGRNNHWGGFSVFSVLPASRAGGANANKADVIAAFKDPANIFHSGCYNSGPNCRAVNGGDQFGLGGDGTNFQQKLCEDTIVIPDWLADGDYVTKWTVYGNGDSFGIRNMAHGDYSNCHNFRVQGGNALAAKPTGNKHIAFTFNDNGVAKIRNNFASLNISPNTCMFSGGAVSPDSCKFINGQNGALCTGPVSDAVRCGANKGADSRDSCLGNSNRATAEGSDLFNYLVGLPIFHPDYKGEFFLLSHTANPAVRKLTLGGTFNPGSGTPGTGTGGGSTTPTNPPGDGNTCRADGNCIASPSCCGAGKICYAKDQFYAGCMVINTCVPGVHTTDPPQYQTPWTCTPLGGVVNTNLPFSIHWKKDTTRVIDNSAARNVNGNQVFMWMDLGPGVAQKWVRTSCGQLQWLNSNRCLDVTGGDDVNGNPLQIWDCSCDNPNQLFEKTAVGGYKWKDHTRCLDVNGGGTQLGTKLQIWDCIDTNINQQFEERLFMMKTNSVPVTYTTLASTLIKPIDVAVDWLNGPQDSFLTVPVGSTISFTGSSDTNPVYTVCGSAFNVAPENRTKECDSSAIIKLSGNTYVVDKEDETVYFVGDSTTVQQRVAIVASNDVSLSASSQIDQLNSQLQLGNSPVNNSPNTVLYIGLGVGAGILLLAVVAFLVFKRKRTLAPPRSKV